MPFKVSRFPRDLSHFRALEWHQTEANHIMSNPTQTRWDSMALQEMLCCAWEGQMCQGRPHLPDKPATADLTQPGCQEQEDRQDHFAWRPVETALCRHARCLNQHKPCQCHSNCCMYSRRAQVLAAISGRHSLPGPCWFPHR